MRAFALLLTFVLSVAACAEEAAAPKYEEGKHYKTIANPIKSPSDKVEITEFFWYGCGHCYSFEPLLKAWKAKLPEGAVLVKSPAMWRGAMQTHAKVYYTAVNLGIEDTAHDKFFKLMNEERKPMTSDAEIQQFFVGLGVDAEKFKKVFSSFAVNNQVSIADSKARGVPIEGTPELLVDGKYRITARMAGGQKQMLEVADFLIEKSLKEKK